LLLLLKPLPLLLLLLLFKFSSFEELWCNFRFLFR
jgi:hypothetical protein